MKTVAVIFSILSASGLAHGKNRSLVLSGTVPLKAEVSVTSVYGQPRVESKSSPELKVEVQKRGPASVVKVSAP